MDRVAERAGVNKERIYQYFGSKQKLFAAVLEQEMTKLAAAVPLTAELAEDLGEFAVRVYDHHRSYPHYLRLLLWEGLETATRQGKPIAAAAERAAHYTDNLAAVARAQKAGLLRDDVDPGYLLYLARALAAWWLAVPSTAGLMLGDAAADATDERRRVLAGLVRDACRPALTG
ncbi:TetR family transcriptional regulator [Amycolatopsis jiangsuensis]|uniref:AcrR family transcriptional regulator n=1 Tax=Amycolatopsis jiangsuensis TaxID=1181879 RepID=A0A840J4X9_9PSEU|nr:TetR family transcriptional regulator [Amycolatopsis jiangsuensis]MBB4688883.1 AcrR family transcriptional regulator [Amycolatopsis jiangsuensis]